MYDENGIKWRVVLPVLVGCVIGQLLVILILKLFGV